MELFHEVGPLLGYASYVEQRDFTGNPVVRTNRKNWITKTDKLEITFKILMHLQVLVIVNNLMLCGLC
jgi:hypothetical protein